MADHRMPSAQLKVLTKIAHETGISTSRTRSVLLLASSVDGQSSLTIPSRSRDISMFTCDLSRKSLYICLGISLLNYFQCSRIR